MDRPPYYPIKVFISWQHTLNSFVGNGFFVTDANINRLKSMRREIHDAARMSGEYTEDMNECLKLITAYLSECYFIKAGGKA